jgi:ubiquinone/menaquinone biosynthesis C-methylase UbiE
MDHWKYLMSEISIEKPDLENEKGLTIEPLLERLPLAHGMIFAEVFAGRGFSTIPVARLLQGTGTVFALEQEGGNLSEMRSKLDDEGLTGWVIPVECAGASFPMPDTSVDLVTWAESFGTTEDSSTYLEEVFRILRPQGHLVIVDKSSGQEEAKSKAVTAGYDLVEDLPLYPGYFTLVLQRPSA